MAGWICAIAAIVAVFTVLAVVVLPRLLFSTRYAIIGSLDRGIKKDAPEGSDQKSIVYAPAPPVRDIIEQYALTDRDGERVLVCKLKGGVKYLDYDVAVFDETGKPVNVFNVKDELDGEYTHPIELPYNTDYVSILVNKADGKTFRNRVIKNVAPGRVVAFLALSILLIAAAVFGIKVCLAKMFAGLFWESFTVLSHSIWVTVAIIGIAAAIITLSVVIAFAVRGRRMKAGRK